MTIRAELQSTVEKSPAVVSRTYVVVRRGFPHRPQSLHALSRRWIEQNTALHTQASVRVGARLRRSFAGDNGALFIGTRPRDGRLARRETDNVGAFAGSVSAGFEIDHIHMETK